MERTWYAGAAQDGPGVFISVLQEVLAERCVRLPMRDIRAAEPREAVQAVESLMCRADY